MKKFLRKLIATSRYVTGLFVIGVVVASGAAVVQELFFPWVPPKAETVADLPDSAQRTPAAARIASPRAPGIPRLPASPSYAGDASSRHDPGPPTTETEVISGPQLPAPVAASARALATKANQRARESADYAESSSELPSGTAQAGAVVGSGSAQATDSASAADSDSTQLTWGTGTWGTAVWGP